jgi:hypothetical protein
MLQRLPSQLNGRSLGRRPAYASYTRIFFVGHTYKCHRQSGPGKHLVFGGGVSFIYVLHNVGDRMDDSSSELLYGWRFTTNQFVLTPSPLRSRPEIFFQLNPCGQRPYVASSLTRRCGFGSPVIAYARTQEKTPLPTIPLLLHA